MQKQTGIQGNSSVEVSWGMALKVFWWWGWRTGLFSMVGGGVLGFIIGLVLGVMGKNVADYILVIKGVSFTWGMACSIFFFKELMGQSFKGFSILAVAGGK